MAVRICSLFSGSLSSMTPVGTPPIMKPLGATEGSSYLSRMSAPFLVGSYSTWFLIASFFLALSESNKLTLDSSSCVSTRLPSLSINRWSLSVIITDSPSFNVSESCLTFIFGTEASPPGASFLFLPSSALAVAPFMLPSAPRVLSIHSAAPPCPSSFSRMSAKPAPCTRSSWSLFDFAAAAFRFDSLSLSFESSAFLSAGAKTGSFELPLELCALPSLSFWIPSFSRSALLSSTDWLISPALGGMLLYHTC
mmetsp:Transcript_23534/g.44400  ORF Transcript_23534/g.44400 Transcript_23534/m.44400 type:complete len:252 (-) Transcript_23534:51-806(-)